jgi:large subunit ribosomal protein L18
VKATITGDKILVNSNSRQLSKDFGWNFYTGNLPSAYLTGYLCGLRAKKAEIDDAILDVGIFVHMDQVKAAFKGFLDAGIVVPHDDEWFAETMNDRISGTHIKAYAEQLSSEDPEKYNKIFGATLKRKADPTRIVDEFNSVKEQMEKKI